MHTRHRLPPMFGRAPINQLLSLGVEALLRRRRREIIVVDVDLVSRVIGAYSDRTIASGQARAEGKEGRSDRDSHQGRLQASTHTETLDSEPQKSSRLPSRNLTENP